MDPKVRNNVNHISSFREMKTHFNFMLNVYFVTSFGTTTSIFKLTNSYVNTTLLDNF